MSDKLASFLLISYNQERFIKDAVLSAFAQDYSPLEIIISDDCSVDSTYLIIENLVSDYVGPHAIRLNRNSANVGLTANLNRAFEMASGSCIVIAAGDDVSLPNRTTDCMNIFTNNPSVSSVLMSADIIDDAGKLLGEKKLGGSLELCFVTLENLIAGNWTTFGAGRAVRASVYNEFAGLSVTCPTEDTPYLLRSLLVGKVALSNKKGIRYRIHGCNLGSNASLATMNLKDIMKQYDIDIAKAVRAGLVASREGMLLSAYLMHYIQERRVIRLGSCWGAGAGQFVVKILLFAERLRWMIVFASIHPRKCTNQFLKKQ